VPLPVILRVEGFIAGQERATVREFVSFHIKKGASKGMGLRIF
jgi:hypothetical protein